MSDPGPSGPAQGADRDASDDVVFLAPRRNRGFIAELLRQETVGGALVLGAALIAVILANSPAEAAYQSLLDTRIGPAALHLDLTVATWAKDGLLAIFFFVAGLELKREFVEGELSKPKEAILPVVSAVFGMLGPAIIYLTVTGFDPATSDGWAIPVATDIAFALAVLAVTGSFLPSAMRIFLLTLAVVDDLLAITIIAIFYTEELHPLPLLVAAAGLVGWVLLQRARVYRWAPYIVLAVVIWTAMHESGVHATVAGVLMGFATRVRRKAGDDVGPAEWVEHRMRPISAGVAVPLFAFCAAGVTINATALQSLFTDLVPLGVLLGLVLGKPLGVLLGAWLSVRLGVARLQAGLTWFDVAGLAVLAGIGFTVSLLIAELAFPDNPALGEAAKGAVLIGSVIAATLGIMVLRLRNARYRRLALAVGTDE